PREPRPGRPVHAVPVDRVALRQVGGGSAGPPGNPGGERPRLPVADREGIIRLPTTRPHSLRERGARSPNRARTPAAVCRTLGSGSERARARPDAALGAPIQPSAITAIRRTWGSLSLRHLIRRGTARSSRSQP